MVLVEFDATEQERAEWDRIQDSLDRALDALCKAKIRADVYRNEIKDKYGIEGIPIVKRKPF